jgi:arsenate reductase
VSTLRLLHNPRCSKSREALALLREHGVEPEIIEYLKTPLDIAMLQTLCQALQREPVALIRFKEDIAKQLGLQACDARPRQEWLHLLAHHPVLLERPIAWQGDSAVIGRPTEALAEWLKTARR